MHRPEGKGGWEVDEWVKGKRWRKLERGEAKGRQRGARACAPARAGTWPAKWERMEPMPAQVAKTGMRRAMAGTLEKADHESGACCARICAGARARTPGYTRARALASNSSFAKRGNEFKRRGERKRFKRERGSGEWEEEKEGREGAEVRGSGRARARARARARESKRRREDGNGVESVERGAGGRGRGEGERERARSAPV